MWHSASFWPTVLSVEPLARCVVCRLSVCLWLLYRGKTVRPSKKVSEGVNRKPGSKSLFFGSLPYFYFRFHRYGHRDGRFCLIFARTAKQSVLDGRNWLSSSKPCVLSDCVVRIETGLWVIRLHYVDYIWNVVRYLTTVEWTTRPQCMGDGRGLPWALAAGH